MRFVRFEIDSHVSLRRSLQKVSWMVPRSIMIGIAIVEQEVTFRSPSLLHLFLSSNYFRPPLVLGTISRLARGPRLS